MDASFEPYGRLLRMLMPSLRGIVVHDGFSNLVWASDEWDLAAEPEIVKDAISNALADTADFAGVMRMPDADRVVYSFAVRGGHLNQLTEDPTDAEPDFSADGRTIAFVRGGDIWATRADGSGQHLLTSGGSVLFAWALPEGGTKATHTAAKAH